MMIDLETAQIMLAALEAHADLQGLIDSMAAQGGVHSREVDIEIKFLYLGGEWFTAKEHDGDWAEIVTPSDKRDAS